MDGVFSLLCRVLLPGLNVGTYVESGGVSSLRLRSGTRVCREELAQELSRTRRGRATEAFAARYLEKLSGVFGVRLDDMMDSYMKDNGKELSREEGGEETIASVRVRGKGTIYKTELDHSVKMGLYYKSVPGIKC